jgi:hypothetical protein
MGKFELVKKGNEESLGRHQYKSEVVHVDIVNHLSKVSMTVLVSM